MQTKRVYSYLEVQEKPVGKIIARVEVTDLSYFDKLKEKSRLEKSVNLRIYHVYTMNSITPMPTFDL